MLEVKDRKVQYPNRYKLVNTETGETVATYDLVPETGEVIEEGTPINRELFESIANDFNKLQGPAGTIKVGKVTKAPPTAEPKITNVGTPTQAVLDFELPQGAKGETGEPIEIVSNKVEFVSSESGTETPSESADWSNAVPYVEQGAYLWTRTTVNYSDGTDTVSYSVARFGIDGKGGTPIYLHSIELRTYPVEETGRIYFSFFSTSSERTHTIRELTTQIYKNRLPSSWSATGVFSNMLVDSFTVGATETDPEIRLYVLCPLTNNNDFKLFAVPEDASVIHGVIAISQQGEKGDKGDMGVIPIRDLRD